MVSFTRQEALDYHRRGRPGKIQIAPTKPLDSQLHLSLAYSPGVAEAVLEIEKQGLIGSVESGGYEKLTPIPRPLAPIKREGVPSKHFRGF